MKKLYLVGLVVTIVAVHAPAQVLPKVSAGGLKADVSFLASDALQGRGTPSPGLDVAAEYIAAQFRRAGLEPAGDDDYFQTASYQTVTPNVDGLSLTLEFGDKALKADSAAMSLQEPVAADIYRVPAVRVAITDSTTLDALATESVRGKVLLAELSESGGAAFAAMRRLPDVVGRLEPALVVLLRSSAMGVNLRPRLREASAPASRVPVIIVWDSAIRTALGASGNATISAHVSAPAVQAVKLRNVVGILRGSDPALKDTYVVVSAHYDHLGVRGAGEGDHIYNGANDDASGAASVIAVAGALSSLLEKPKRSLVFMTFFGEESGGLGSRYYCQHPAFPLEKTVADVNLEQLGRTDDTEGPRPLQFNLTGFDYTNLAGIFSKAGEETGIKVVKHAKNSDAFFAASDNVSFSDRGIPSTTISVSYIFPDYHKAGDEWQKLDYENMARVDAAIALGLLHMANSSEAPHWNSDNPKVARYIQARAAK